MRQIRQHFYDLNFKIGLQKTFSYDIILLLIYQYDIMASDSASSTHTGGICVKLTEMPHVKLQIKDMHRKLLQSKIIILHQIICLTVMS